MKCLIKLPVEKVCVTPAVVKTKKEIFLLDHLSEVVRGNILTGGDFSG